MTQPAVTFQIKQLEEHFNTRLFDRGHVPVIFWTAQAIDTRNARDDHNIAATDQCARRSQSQAVDLFVD